MEHLGTKELETNRLILRRFTINDAEKMFNNWANDDEVTKYLRWQSHKSINNSIGFLEYLTKNYCQNNVYDWAIILKEINEPIGSIGVVNRKDDIKMVEIGYCIGKKWWNKGITSEVLNRIIDFFFNEVGVNRIEAFHVPENKISGKVMTKCGMKYEGLMRQAFLNNNGKLCDIIHYGIIAEDFIKK